jgi:hypothetical protein
MKLCAELSHPSSLLSAAAVTERCQGSRNNGNICSRKMKLEGGRRKALETMFHLRYVGNRFCPYQNFLSVFHPPTHPSFCLSPLHLLPLFYRQQPVTSPPSLPDSAHIPKPLSLTFKGGSVKTRDETRGGREGRTGGGRHHPLIHGRPIIINLFCCLCQIIKLR